MRKTRVQTLLFVYAHIPGIKPRLIPLVVDLLFSRSFINSLIFVRISTELVYQHFRVVIVTAARISVDVRKTSKDV